MLFTIKLLRFKFTNSLLIIGCIATFLCCGPEVSRSDTAEYAKLLETYSNGHRFKGQVLIAKSGHIQFERQVHQKNKVPTSFEFPELNSAFIATLFLKLEAKGLVNLDTKVGTLLDVKLPILPETSIHELLIDQSGLPKYMPLEEFASYEHLIPLFSENPAPLQIRDQPYFKGANSLLLAAILEKITQQSYTNLVTNELLHPLGLEHTYFNDQGQLITTLHDLYLWNSQLTHYKVLPKSPTKRLFFKHRSTRGFQYGYGYDTGSLPLGAGNTQVEVHALRGQLYNSKTLMLWMPATETLLLLHSSTPDGPLVEMAAGLVAITFNKAYDTLPKSLALSVKKRLLKEPLETVLQDFEQQKSASEFYLNEIEMKQTAYALLESQAIDEALALLNLNIETYPESYKAYKHYAEVQVLLGDTEQAILSYKEALKYHPQNASITFQLEQLQEASR